MEPTDFVFILVSYLNSSFGLYISFLYSDIVFVWLKLIQLFCELTGFIIYFNSSSSLFDD